MASKFQKQLVGSIILVGISVIVLPSLFDGKKWNDAQKPTTIALYPVSGQPSTSDNLSNQEPDIPPGDWIATEPTETISQSNPAVLTSEATSSGEQTPASNTQSSYVIQLAAVSKKEDANELIAELTAAGFNAFTIQTKQLHRIFVGPSPLEQNLIDQLPLLKQLTGLDGQLMKIK